MNDSRSFQRPRPMPFPLLLDEAVWQARRHVKTLYVPVAIPLTLYTTLMAVAQILWLSRTSAPAPGSTPFGSPEFILLTIVNLGLLLIAVMTLQVGVMDILAGRPVDMGRAWRFAFRGRVLVTVLLCYGVSIVSMVCCCVLPGLFVVPILSFTSAVMVEEDRFVIDAVSRSLSLALYGPEQFFERPWAKMFLLFLVGMLISTALASLVAVPFQIPMFIDTVRQVGAGEDTLPNVTKWLWLHVPAQFLSSLVSTALYIYMTFGIALLFYDARGRKEGVDLRSEIDQVFGAPPPELPLG